MEAFVSLTALQSFLFYMATALVLTIIYVVVYIWVTPHPEFKLNLLPTYFEGDPDTGMLNDAFVRKPLLSRQGANIEIVQGSRPETVNDGPYGGEGYIIQAFNPLPEFDGNYLLVGCWLVASKGVGMCIREDRTLITGKDARFIPHVILN